MLPDAAKAKRPKWRRPRKNPLPLPPTQPEQVEHTVQRKSGGSLSQPNVPSPPLPLPPPEPPPVPLVAGVGVESATTTVPPITEIDPISVTQYPVVRTPQHPPALDPWVQRPRRSNANYSTEIYARNGQGRAHGAWKENRTNLKLNRTQSPGVDELRTVARDRQRKENTDGIRRLTGGDYELGDDAADDEGTDDDEADDDEAADDDETAGGDGDKTDEEESGSREGDGADEGEIRKKSAVYLHLLSCPNCLSVYDDSHFSVLCRARYVQQLKVLEAVCIRTHKPDLCKQKEHVEALGYFREFDPVFMSCFCTVHAHFSHLLFILALTFCNTYASCVTLLWLFNLCFSLDIFNEDNLKLNTQKTEYVDVTRNSNEWRSNKLLGFLLGSAEDVDMRISKANRAFVSISWRRHSFQSQMCMFNCLIMPILLYNCGLWTLSTLLNDKLDKWQRRKLRVLLQIVYAQRITNNNLYTETKQSPVSATCR